MSVDKAKIREIVLWIILADFPALYVGAVSLEQAALTIGALAVMAAAAVVAAIVF